MKPIKGLLQLSNWLMRSAIVFFVFVAFIDTLKTFDFKSIQFYLALAFIIFGVLLFIGGFLGKTGLTVFSGLMLFFAAVFEIITLSSSGILAEVAIYSVIAASSLYFASAGR